MLSRFLRKGQPTLTLRAYTHGGAKQLAHYTNLSQAQVNKIITLLSQFDDNTSLMIKVTPS